MIVLDFACGFKLFCKRPMIPLQQFLPLSVPRFEVHALPASALVGHSRPFITVHTEKEP